MKLCAYVIVTLLAMIILGSRAIADQKINMKYCVDYIKSDQDLATFYPLTADGKVDAAARANLTRNGGIAEWTESVDRKTGDETTSIKAYLGSNPNYVKRIHVRSQSGLLSSIEMLSTIFIKSQPFPDPNGPTGSGLPTYTSSHRMFVSFEVINNTCIPKVEVVGPAQLSMTAANLPFQPNVGPFYMDTRECRRFKVAFDNGLNAENIASSSVNKYVPEYQNGGTMKFTPQERLSFAKLSLNKCNQRVGISEAINDEQIWKDVKLEGEAESPETGR